MRRQIIHLSVGQTSKVLAVMYGLMGLIFLPFLLVASVMAPESSGIGIGVAIAMPILYAVLGYVFVAIGCAMYNFVAARVGGIEVEVADMGAAG